MHIMLVCDGHFLRDAMKHERVTESEVLAAIRQGGLDSIEEVGALVLETDGSFSVIRMLGSSPSVLRGVKGAEPK